MKRNTRQEKNMRSRKQNVFYLLTHGFELIIV